MNSSPEIEAAMKGLIAEYNIASEKLTRDQLAKCILQAIACGDFIARVQISTSAPLGQVGPQAVFYVPYARYLELITRIKELEAQLQADTEK